MVLDAYRKTADVALLPLARRLAHIHPDVFTWAAFACALAAAACFALPAFLPLDPLTFLIPAILLVFSNALLDALDGKVAKVTGKASARGDFLDHVLDRYADVAMLLGITLGPFSGNVLLGLVAIVGVLLASYMGTQAQAVGVGRDYGGLLGRADRLVIMIMAGVLQVFYAPGVQFGFSVLIFSPLEWALLLFAILGNVTAVQRAATTWRKFGRR